MVQGLRQADGAAAIAATPAASYKDSRTDRVADLAIDEHGDATGSVTLSFRGAPALRWRQAYLRGDETSFHHNYPGSLEHTFYVHAIVWDDDGHNDEFSASTFLNFNTLRTGPKISSRAIRMLSVTPANSVGSTK